MSGRKFSQNAIVIVATLMIVGGAIYFSSRLVISPTHPMLPTTPASSMTTAPAPAATANLPPAIEVTATITVATPASPSSSAISPLPTGVITELVSPLNVQSPLPTVAIAPAVTATTQLSGATPIYTYTVVNIYPHDPEAFTEGLVFDRDILYEGTGLQGRSNLRKVDLATGKVLQQLDLAPAFFGEGITILGNRIYQLTWQSHQGFVYDKSSLTQQQEFSYPTEGWGLTNDGTRLIMSDGTARLYFRDPTTMAEVGHVDVYDEHGPVLNLNELEYVQGEIYANVWQTDRIARINPTSGRVVGWIDLTGLAPQPERTNADAVLNGIAYMPEADRLFVTGKLWPTLFEIKLQPK